MIFYVGYLGMSLMTLACHLRIYCRFLDRLIFVIKFNRVDLPTPDGPTNATTSPAWIF